MCPPIQIMLEMKGFLLIFDVQLSSLISHEDLKILFCKFYEVSCYVMQQYSKSYCICLFFERSVNIGVYRGSMSK